MGADIKIGKYLFLNVPIEDRQAILSDMMTDMEKEDFCTLDYQEWREQNDR